MDASPDNILEHSAGAVADSALSTGSDVLERLGERVREARDRAGLSRKLLAEQSGVSERYLALLESGRGNASVLVLQRISSALKLAPETLLQDRDCVPAELAAVEQLLHSMTPQQLVRARARLLDELRSDAVGRSQRIALIGLRGAGKTTLGKKLAQSLQRTFIQLDREIERAAGTRLSEIFLLYGQQGYRRYERHCLEQLLQQRQPCVIATGGSIVSEPATYELLLATCYTVWIRARPEQHMQRVIAQGDARPMAGNAQAMADLQRILTSRSPLYSRADAIVDTAEGGIEDSLAQLQHCIEPPEGGI